MMKSTGIVRRADELGRIVIPMELRKKMGIEEKDPMEIYVEGNNIILRKYEPSCTFCGSCEDTILHKGKIICKKCQTEIKALGKLPNNCKSYTRSGVPCKLSNSTGIPMEQALTPSQCDVVRLFLADLINAADACKGKKDIGRFMRAWSEIYSEGKRVAV